MKLHEWEGDAKSLKDLVDHTQPSRTTAIDAIRALPGEAFYPAKIVSEAWQDDPRGPT